MNPLQAEKKKKLDAIREKGVDPYPHSFRKSFHTRDVIELGEPLEAGNKLDEVRPEQTETVYRVAGRLMTKRPMGKAAFFNIRDQFGDLQIYLRKEELPVDDVFVFEHSDIGDWVGVQGRVFKTQKGEVSLHAERFFMLSKSLEPLPEKFHGLTDVETIYRNRHLDLIMSMDSRRVFEVRSSIIREVRRFLDQRGFMEVETPMLQPIYGGAAAFPFSTHHRALDMKLFLKISPELYLKRLIVGGFEKVYEINKNFRNEGIDRTHNPEFTMLEYYEAFTDYFDQMVQFEELVEHLVMTVRGTPKFNYRGREIDFTRPWKRISVVEGLESALGSSVVNWTEKDFVAAIESAGGAVDPKLEKTRGELMMDLFGLVVEPTLWNPTFVIDFPVEVSPLTKNHREKPGLVERFEPIAAGMEIGNAYTELNDPEDQLQRLLAQEKKRVVDEEAQPMDTDFLKAIDVGMPPTGGVGLGIERMVMILTDQDSIRDILLFPLMKPIK